MNLSTSDLYWDPIRLTPPGMFIYPPQNNLQYPACSIFSGLGLGSKTALIDYTFLDTIVYQDPNTFQNATDAWFGTSSSSSSSSADGEDNKKKESIVKWDFDVTRQFR